MIYQNVHGLSCPDRERSSVVGESVLFSLLLQYPECPKFGSLMTNTKYFQVSFLDERSSLFEISLFKLKTLVHQEYMFSDLQNY